MNILVFGGHGMAGHMIIDYFEKNTDYELYYTVRGKAIGDNIFNINVTDMERVKHLLEFIKPEIVINAVGVLNEDVVKKPKEAIFVNSFFPHLLADYGKVMGYRLIHISTDCVFSGKEGSYKEKDLPDGLSAYAKTKSLGEIIDDTHTTIRTSIIGPELKPDGIGLFHWFMNQTAKIKGYRNVFWSGVTTLELAKVIHLLLSRPIKGLIHLTAPQKISKFDLLTQLKTTFNKSLVIDPFEDIISDKSLRQSRKDFLYEVPSYQLMIEELKQWMVTQTKRKYPYIF